MHVLELVPRDLDHCLQLAKEVKAKFPHIEGFNIPDILRVPHRSHEVAALFLESGLDVIPHVRTIDRPVEDTLKLVEGLLERGLKRVLFVTGDLPTGLSQRVYRHSPEELIQACKKRFSGLKVYAGLDPYRSKLIDELEKAHHRLDMGADGLFSQPFFCPNLAQFFLKQLDSADLFLGVSPVLTEPSLTYWQTRNQAVFPGDFALNMERNIEIAHEIINESRKRDQHIYLMPIKTDVVPYLEAVYY